MLSFLFRRLLQTIPTVLAVVALVFVLFSVVPGSIVSSMSDDADPQVELRMKKQLGLDDPVYVRFGAYIAKLATGLSLLNKHFFQLHSRNTPRTAQHFPEALTPAGRERQYVV
jgi:ABC-type dipeptide/oligopeptide/nickel transport system permease component